MAVRKSQQIRTATPFDRMAVAARDAGVPRDQLERFLTFGYVPQLKQLEFHAACRSADKPNGPTDIGYGGARAGGKSRAVLSQLALDDCQRMPNLKCLFLRKIGKAARESFEDLRRQALMGVPHHYSGQKGLLEFPNRSRIVLGHFKNESDIDAYLGLEYDVIAIEEDTQLSPGKKRDVKTCLRTSKPNWRPRTYRTTNPGGIDHAGFKKTFIEPWRKQQETSTRFIPATVRDNVFVNSEYRHTLESLTGWQRQAWLNGEWDIAAGQFFSTWRHDKHTRKPFLIPETWPCWAAMDYGYNHPTVVYLFTENDGIVYVVDELWVRKQLPSQIAPQIKAMLERHGTERDGVKTPRALSVFVAGDDVSRQRGDQFGKTIADQYLDYGIQLTNAYMDRVNGWAEVLKRLGDLDNGIDPTIQIFDRCVKLIECLPNLQHDPKRPEDVLKVDIDEDGDGGDDAGDCLRYGIASKPGVMSFS